MRALGAKAGILRQMSQSSYAKMYLAEDILKAVE
jgi:hypothetical protein